MPNQVLLGSVAVLYQNHVILVCRLSYGTPSV